MAKSKKLARILIGLLLVIGMLFTVIAPLYYYISASSSSATVESEQS